MRKSTTKGEKTAVTLRKKGLGAKSAKSAQKGKAEKSSKTAKSKGTNGKPAKKAKSSSADQAQLVVVSKLKEAIKGKDLRIGGDFPEAFNQAVNKLLGDSIARCRANGRQTVKEFDAV